MSGFFAPWKCGTAAVVAGLIAATAAVSRTPPPGPPQAVDDRYVPMWVLGGRPELPLDRVQRFTRRADPAQRAAVARIVTEEAQAQGVPVQLALAVAHVESGMRPAHAVVGPPTRYGRAVGSMQILPSTGRSIGCGNLRDTRENARCGTRYLSIGLRHCNGDIECAARFYHGGPNTRLHGRVTHGYGRRVASMVRRDGGPVRGASFSLASGDDRYFREWWLSR